MKTISRWRLLALFGRSAAALVIEAYGGGSGSPSPTAKPTPGPTLASLTPSPAPVAASLEEKAGR